MLNAMMSMRTKKRSLYMAIHFDIKHWFYNLQETYQRTNDEMIFTIFRTNI